MSLGRCSWSEVNKGEGKRLTTLSQVPHKPNFETYCPALQKEVQGNQVDIPRFSENRPTSPPVVNTGSNDSPIPSSEMSTVRPPAGP